MSKITYNIQHDEDESVVSIKVPGEPMRSARDDHPSFDQAVALLEESRQEAKLGDEETAFDLAYEAYELIDLQSAIARRFDKLSERVSIHSGRVFFDGDPVEGPLMDQIIKMWETGGDFQSLVNFYERLQSNPLGHAREALYAWVDDYGLTITTDGMLIGYKRFSTKTDPETGEVLGYRPSRKSTNPDRVNGQEVKLGEYMVVNPGDVVETPRSLVLHEPSAACAEGLHIGNWSYPFSGDAKFAVKFSPRDVVNVPNSEGKLRVSRFEVLHIVDAPYTEPVIDLEADDDEDTGWMGDSKPETGPTASDLNIIVDAFRDAMGRFVKGNGGRPGSRRGPDGKFA